VSVHVEPQPCDGRGHEEETTAGQCLPTSCPLTWAYIHYQTYRAIDTPKEATPGGREVTVLNA
jgi:hypothetical protein